MNDLKVTEYNNNRVLTTQQIAEAYEDNGVDTALYFQQQEIQIQ